MPCDQCVGIERQFDGKLARRELKRYRKKGPVPTTRLLADALIAEDVEGKTLLDIGGGVGALQHAVMQGGGRQATSVDASPAYLEAAQDEARRLGYAERAVYRHGDFVDLAPDVPPADIVTLDRVLCCYPDMEQLVEASLTHARALYGVVYPRDTWWLKGIRVGVNFVSWLRRTPFRFFVHPTEAVEAAIQAQGFQCRYHRQTLLWQVAVYGR